MSWLNGFNQDHLNTLPLFSKQSPSWLTETLKNQTRQYSCQGILTFPIWFLPLYISRMKMVHAEEEARGALLHVYWGACLRCQSRKQLPVCKMVWGTTCRNHFGYLLVFAVQVICDYTCFEQGGAGLKQQLDRKEEPFKMYPIKIHLKKKNC